MSTLKNQQISLFKNKDYNFLHTSKGKNDECYTKRYAVEVLLEFLDIFLLRLSAPEQLRCTSHSYGYSESSPLPLSPRLAHAPEQLRCTSPIDSFEQNSSFCSSLRHKLSAPEQLRCTSPIDSCASCSSQAASLRHKLVIWCPFDKNESQFVQVLKENGFNVVNSHIDYGQDFYNYEPEKWDILISNPPFTKKREIFERALSFEKPFALIMNVAWLLDSAPAKLFENKDLQLLLFKNRMEFDRPQDNTGLRINFSAGYFCWNFLPKQIIFRTLQIPRRKHRG